MNRNKFILFSAIFLAGSPSVGLAQDHLSDLQKALKSQDRELVQAFLQSFSPDDPETQAMLSRADEDGRSPLLSAIREGLGFPIIRRILSLGADVNQAHREGKTALIYAAGKGYMGLVQELLNKGAKVDHADSFGWINGVLPRPSLWFTQACCSFRERRIKLVNRTDLDSIAHVRIVRP